jgi:hypothetical protein
MEGLGLVWMLMGFAGLLIIALLILLLIQALRHQAMDEVLALQGHALANQQAVNKQLLDERKEASAALRAERAHVAQLQRKVELLQVPLSDHLAGVKMSF